MFEKVNPMHPDKIADRIAGALVDLAYKNQENPKVAIEVLIGHGTCNITGESSYEFNASEVEDIVNRIAKTDIYTVLNIVKQDEHLANNQSEKIRCGDNGIFKGMPTTIEQARLSEIADKIYRLNQSDGKYILNGNKLIVCQSNTDKDLMYSFIVNNILDIKDPISNIIVNPIGDWTGGLDVDTGATNRKLGSDMGDAVTGGGLHGKDLSKADVSLNIYCFMLATQNHCKVEAMCGIGDDTISFRLIKNETTIDIITIDYETIVNEVRKFIDVRGGFEKFAEWGLI